MNLQLPEVIITGKKYRVKGTVNGVLSWIRTSFWTKASDVELDNGSNVEEKISELTTTTSNTSNSLNTHKNSSDHDSRYYLKAEIDSKLNDKSPTNHASSNTSYGVGNSTNYGHVRLSDSISDTSNGTTNGIAATPKAVNQSYTLANSALTATNNLQTYVNNTVYPKATNAYDKAIEAYNLASTASTKNNISKIEFSSALTYSTHWEDQLIYAVDGFTTNKYILEIRWKLSTDTAWNIGTTNSIAFYVKTDGIYAKYADLSDGTYEFKVTYLSI